MRDLIKASRIAQKLGVSTSTFYNWVADGRYPSPDTNAPGGRGMGLWYVEVADAWAAEYDYLLDQGNDTRSAAEAATELARRHSAAIKTRVRADRERLARRRERYRSETPPESIPTLVAT